jgi:hypothetical protein
VKPRNKAERSAAETTRASAWSERLEKVAMRWCAFWRVLSGSVSRPPTCSCRRFSRDLLLYYAFDLLYLDGFDLRLAPVIERKRVLAELLGKACGPILYSEHFEEDGGRDVRARLRHARSVDGAVTTPVPGYVA